MARFYSLFFSTAWLAWIVYWGVLSRRTKLVERRESIRSRWSYLLPLLLSVGLLFPPRLPVPILSDRFLPLSMWPAWGAIGAALLSIGLLFSVWARRHLGSNWSDIVTVKEDHDLVMTGPYGYVRHPIYTGLLLALIGQCIARGELRGILAVALALYGFMRKLRIEEIWMRERFGARYAAYSKRVAALVPHVL